jgi:hypothetical protein
MFSSNLMYSMWYLLIYFFCYGFPLKGMRANNCFREGSRGVKNIHGFNESASAVSLRLRNLHFENFLIETAESDGYIDYLGKF